MAIDHRHRILIADDDPSIRTALRATLEAEGYWVMDVVDGREAIEALAREIVDVAILDLAMPHFDGLEVLKEVRRVRGMTVPPVLILTAYDSVTAAMESARRGAVDFLRKPITPNALCAAVRQAIVRGGMPLSGSGDGAAQHSPDNGLQ